MPSDVEGRPISSYPVDAIVETLQRDLARDLEATLQTPVAVTIESIRSGSLVITFSVIGGFLLGTFHAVSRYKNFVESAELIRDHSQVLVGETLRRFGARFAVSVTCVNALPGKRPNLRNLLNSLPLYLLLWGLFANVLLLFLMLLVWCVQVLRFGFPGF